MIGLVIIPKTTLAVSPLCLGTGEIGSALDRAASFALLDDYWEGGENTLDTAHNYGDWVPGLERSASERMIGAWMHERKNRDTIVLATKGAHWNLDTPQQPRLSRNDIEADLDGSLTSLDTDRIDLYWLHRDDPAQPVADILATLNDAVQAGKVRYFGASNWTPARLREAQEHAQAAGLRGFSGDQVLWNAAILAQPPYGDPTVGWMDDARFAFHQETGMALFAFQSQAYGLFQRMHDGTLDEMNPGMRRFYAAGPSGKRYEAVAEVMDETGLSVTQVILGYLLSQPFATIPILGCRSRAQLTDSLSASAVRLSSAQVQAIRDAAQTPEF